MAKIIRMKKTKPKRKGKVIDITERRREAMDLAQFIDAHGGKLKPVRAYRVAPPPPPNAP
jgi:hypothetical protein